jgi:hypothetical protein
MPALKTSEFPSVIAARKIVEYQAERYNEMMQNPEKDLTYREACRFAIWLFQKYYASDEHYASGGVVWEPCYSTAGVMSQIDNMLAGLDIKRVKEVYND